LFAALAALIWVMCFQMALPQPVCGFA